MAKNAKFGGNFKPAEYCLHDAATKIRVRPHVKTWELAVTEPEADFRVFFHQSRAKADRRRQLKIAAGFAVIPLLFLLLLGAWLYFASVSRRGVREVVGRYELDRVALLHALLDGPLPGKEDYEDKVRETREIIASLPEDQRAIRQPELEELIRRLEDVRAEETRKLAQAVDMTLELHADGTYACEFVVPTGAVMRERGRWRREGDLVKTTAEHQSVPEELQENVTPEGLLRIGKEILEVPPSGLMTFKLILRRQD